MKRITIMGLALIAAFAVMVASASAEGTGPKTFLRTAGGGLLKKGDVLVASSSNLVFTTSAGNLECSTNVISGPVKTNGKEKPSGEINFTEDIGEEVFGSETKLCKTTTPLKNTSILTNNKPWKLKFITSSGKVQINTGLGNKKVEFVSTFPESGNVKCKFSTKKVLPTYNEPATPKPLIFTSTNQVFKLETGSFSGCPTEGHLDGTFSVTKGTLAGETVEVEVHT